MSVKRSTQDLITYGNYSDTIVSTKFKNELVLEENNFHLPEQRTNKVALAQVIQNILFFHKGNFPNQPELGVGIEDYLFEPATDETLAELHNNIKTQIEMFIPTDYTINFIIEKANTDGKMNIITITFNIVDYFDEEITEFTILYGRNQKNNKLVSKLIA